MRGPDDFTAQLVANLDAENNLSLGEIIHKFRVRKRLFLTCVVLVPLIAVLLVSLIPPTYKASAELLISQQGGGASFFKDMTADRGGISGQSAAEMIRSIPTCAKMVEVVGVTEDDVARSGVKVILGRFFRLFAPLMGREKEDGPANPKLAAERIAADLKDSIEASTLMVDRSIMNVRDEIVEVKLKSTNRLKVAPMVNELCRIFISDYNERAAEDAMRAYDTLAQQAARVRAEIVALRTEPAQFASAGAQANSTASAGGSSRAKPLAEGMGQRISELELKVIELERVFTEASPELSQAKAEVEQARAMLNRQEALDGAAALLDDIRTKQRQAVVTAALHRSNQSGFTIIEAGLTPPASKGVILLHFGIPAAAGTVLGLLLGTGLVLLFSALDDRVEARDGVDPVPGCRWLGHVTLLAGAKSPALAALPLAENLPALLRVRGKIEDAARTGLQTLLVTTGDGANDGGMAALQIACLIAKDRDYQVLLVDADIGAASLSRALDFHAKPGLIEVLNGSGALPEFIQGSELKNLKILPAGNLAQRESLGFFKKRWEQMLVDLRSSFQIVVVYAPSIVDVAEVAVLAQRADHAVFVAQAGATRAAALARAVAVLGRIAVPILGALLVRAPGGRKAR